MNAPAITANDPPCRSKRKWLWLWLLLIPIALILWAAQTYFIWDGAVTRPVRVRVLDSSSSSPLAGATVTLIQTRDAEIAKTLDTAAATEMLQRSHRLVVTDEHGEATLTGLFGAGGEIWLFVTRGRFHPEGMLLVTRPGYKAEDGMLQNFLQVKELPISTKSLEVKVFLSPE